MRDNLARVKALAPNSKIWSVVKANAYGHSLEAAYQGLLSTDGFALLDISQALRLRELGWTRSILILEGIFSKEELEVCLSLQLDVVFHHAQQVEWLESWLTEAGVSIQAIANKRIKCWLKMNSGMNRLGINPNKYKELYHRLHSLGFKVNHLTHFANSDDLNSTPTVDQQLEIFEKGTNGLLGDKSLANSGAIMWHRHTQADWCRPGIMLYGASPSGLNKDILHTGLKPAMLLRSEIISVREVSPDQSVGYGGKFKPQGISRIAVIACGYADGYPRHAPDGTPVWVANGANLHLGAICPLVGRVSMDMITVDITQLPHADVGSPVELWGEYVAVDDVAQAAGTVGYELMCALAPRVPMKIS